LFSILYLIFTYITALFAVLDAKETKMTLKVPFQSRKETKEGSKGAEHII